MKKYAAYILAVCCILLGIGLVVFPPQRMLVLDDVADAYFEDSITKASVAYGTTRLINAGVSVVQESTLQLEPGGVGVAIGVGQVADPLNDMTERLSSVLVTSMVSLTVQKIAYEIAQFFAFQLIGAILIVVSILSLIKNRFALAYRNLFLKVMLFLFVVRLFLPCSAIISSELNEQLFFPQLEMYQARLDPFVRDFAGLTTFQVPEVRGIGDVFSGPVKMLAEKNQQLNTALTLLVTNGVEIFGSLIGIMGQYLGIFVIQVLFLPIFMFWLLNKLVFVLFSQTIPQPTNLGFIPVNRRPVPPGSKENTEV